MCSRSVGNNYVSIAQQEPSYNNYFVSDSIRSVILYRLDVSLVKELVIKKISWIVFRCGVPVFVWRLCLALKDTL